MGYFLINPARGWIEKPQKLAAQLVQPGMTVVEIGPGMGFYTLPFARLVGEKGRVIAIELQERMLRVLQNRIDRVDLMSRVECRRCSADSLGVEDLRGQADLILLCHVVHEMVNSKNLFREIIPLLKPSGRVLFTEPRGEVNQERFDKNVEVARDLGLSISKQMHVFYSHAVLLVVDSAQSQVAGTHSDLSKACS